MPKGRNVAVGHSNSDSNSKYDIGLGSTGKTVIKLGKTVMKPKITPPSPIKTIPTLFARGTNDVWLTSFNNDDDVTMTSSSQNKEVHMNYSTHLPEGKSAAVVAIMRGKPKDGYHCHCSSKHYKKMIVQVLLDSGSDSDLVFVRTDKSMLLPYSKRLVPQSWNTWEWDISD
jgi:hypothetical protein